MDRHQSTPTVPPIPSSPACDHALADLLRQARGSRLDVHYLPVAPPALPWCGAAYAIFATADPGEVTCVLCMNAIVAREG